MAYPDIVLTIIISCYNTRDLVARLPAVNLPEPAQEAYEIILVDDASDRRDKRDGDVERFPRFACCETTSTVTMHIRTTGLSITARGRYVLLLNNDTIVLPQALDAMIAFLREHPDAGVVGCKLLNEDGTIQWSVKSLPNPAAAIFGARSFVTKLFPNNRFSRHHLLHIDRDMTQPFVAGFVSGAASMMPLNVMKKVGHLDVHFFYHVDADYCKRIADAGYKCFYLPTAEIIHLNHKGGTMASPLARLRSLMMFEV